MKRMAATFLQLQVDSPFRVLDWRWQQAQQIVAANRRRPRFSVDPQTVWTMDYQRALGQCPDERARVHAASKWPSLAAARELAEVNSPLRWEVEARLLAEQSDAEIAQACALACETVHSYEAIFFHVRDRLTASDWIAGQIGLGPIFAHDLRRIWQHFGYRSGVLVLETIIAITLPRSLQASIAATFSKNPELEERRLLLAAKLAVGAVTMQSRNEAKAMLQVFKEKRALDRQLGDKPLPASEVQRLTLMVQLLARSEQRKASAPRGWKTVSLPYSVALPSSVAPLPPAIGSSVVEGEPCGRESSRVPSVVLVGASTMQGPPDREVRRIEPTKPSCATLHVAVQKSRESVPKSCSCASLARKSRRQKKRGSLSLSLAHLIEG